MDPRVTNMSFSSDCGSYNLAIGVCKVCKNIGALFSNINLQDHCDYATKKTLGGICVKCIIYDLQAIQNTHGYKLLEESAKESSFNKNIKNISSIKVNAFSNSVKTAASNALDYNSFDPLSDLDCENFEKEFQIDKNRTSVDQFANEPNNFELVGKSADQHVTPFGIPTSSRPIKNAKIEKNTIYDHSGSYLEDEKIRSAMFYHDI